MGIPGLQQARSVAWVIYFRRAPRRKTYAMAA